jgi:hypothetical protein
MSMVAGSTNPSQDEDDDDVEEVEPVNVDDEVDGHLGQMTSGQLEFVDDVTGTVG